MMIQYRYDVIDIDTRSNSVSIKYETVDTNLVYNHVSSSVPGRDRPKSLKLVATASLWPNARQQVWMLRVLGNDHYKRLARVTVDVAR